MTDTSHVRMGIGCLFCGQRGSGAIAHSLSQIASKIDMYPQLKTYITQLAGTFEPDAERKQVLSVLTEYIKQAARPQLHFICTHNSRRSHLSQIWAQALAYYVGIEVKTYSGGTEATAFHPNAVEAIRRAGFQVRKEGSENPRYHVSFAEEAPAMVCYSKRFDEAPNPSEGFAAIMTCSEADSACPIVAGADKRIQLFYEDPKISDGTPSADFTYDQRCQQIASEIYFAFRALV